MSPFYGGTETQSIEDYDNLYKDMFSFSECNKLSLATFQDHIDEVLKQCELETSFVHAKPSSMLKRKARMKKNKLNQTSYKRGLTAVAFLSITCLIVASLPVFYDSANNTLVSNFLNDRYVQAVLPKEYGYQLGIFYMNLKFKFARIMRLIVTSLGIQRMIESFGNRGNAIENDRQCFLVNPIFQKPVQPCSLCHGTEGVIFYSYQPHERERHFLERMLQDGNIHVFELSGLETSLQVLQQQVSYHLQAIEVAQHRFMSNIQDVTSVKDLGNKDIMTRLSNDMPSNGHIVWMTEHYTAARLMRQVFPRPSIIPPLVTVMLSKAILLDGPHSPEYSLPMSKRLFVMYIQGTGSRKIRFIPPAGCVVKCSTHTVTTQASDVLIFDAAIWKAYSIPNDDQSSFAYATYLSFDEEY